MQQVLGQSIVVGHISEQHLHLSLLFRRFCSRIANLDRSKWGGGIFSPLHPVSQTKATAAAAALEMVWDEIRQYKKLPQNAKKYSIALTAKIIIFNIEHPSKHFLVD